MSIVQGKVVSFHYTLTDESGAVLNSTDGREPLSYLHGYAGIIPGLERNMEGKQAGDAFSAVIAPEDAYGPVDPELIQDVPLDSLSYVEDLAVGIHVYSRDDDGRPRRLIVDEITDTTATLNANHELAGRTLTFAVRIDSVRDATDEELVQGRVR